MRVDVDVSSIDRKFRLLYSLMRKPEIQKCLTHAVKTTMPQAAIKNIRSNKTIYKGKLVASIKVVEVPVSADPAVDFGSFGLNYAAPIELGTQPYTPPWAPIYEWVVTKIKPRDPYAYTKVVIRSIETSGVKSHPYLIPAFNAQRGAMVKVLKSCVLKRLTRGILS